MQIQKEKKLRPSVCYLGTNRVHNIIRLNINNRNEIKKIQVCNVQEIINW